MTEGRYPAEFVGTWVFTILLEETVEESGPRAIVAIDTFHGDGTVVQTESDASLEPPGVGRRFRFGQGHGEWRVEEAGIRVSILKVLLQEDEQHIGFVKITTVLKREGEALVGTGAVAVFSGSDPDAAVVVDSGSVFRATGTRVSTDGSRVREERM